MLYFSLSAIQTLIEDKKMGLIIRRSVPFLIASAQPEAISLDGTEIKPRLNAVIGFRIFFLRFSDNNIGYLCLLFGFCFAG